MAFWDETQRFTSWEELGLGVCESGTITMMPFWSGAEQDWFIIVLSVLLIY